MNKSLIIATLAVILLVGGFFVFNSFIYNEKQSDAPKNFKEVAYTIEGETDFLGKGLLYFGNEFTTDLDGDGSEDIVFIATREFGGSGTFFYVLAALNTEDGYKGSDGYLLGDRIAPQNIHLSQNARHKNVVVVNYAERAIDEPMSTPPSVGKSVYLKLDVENMQWGIVMPDFEGESR